MNSRKLARLTTAHVVGSTVITDAERGAPSSDISPTYSPGPWKSMTNSLPASLLANTFTLPASRMNSESPCSPSLISTAFFGNWRTTPVAAIARSVSSARGAKGSAGAEREGTGASAAAKSPVCMLARWTRAGRGNATRKPGRVCRNHPTASTGLPAPARGSPSIVFAHVVDHLAVVRQLARARGTRPRRAAW